MTKLNLGCNDRKLDGFDNLDKIYGWLFQDGLEQYPDGSVEAITISHALMFLTKPELETFIKEAFRALRTNGVIRITEDDTENPLSDTYRTGCRKAGPKCLTGPKMMRTILEGAGFSVFDVDESSTQFTDKSLMQNYHKGRPRCFFIEGVKGSALLEGIKMKGEPFEILNASRDDMPQFFKEMGFGVGAEIGVDKGEFSEKFCRAGLKLYAIDPWKVYKDYDLPRGQEKWDIIYEHTKKSLALYPDCTIIRKTSMEAVEDFADGSLDFVYIDGNHHFKYVAEDLVEWTKKVRPGGIVSGHDYDFFHSSSEPHTTIWDVPYVVDAFIQAFGISNWYLIGSKDRLPGEKRSRWRSWMFVKP